VSDIYVDGDACPVREEVYRVAVPAGLRRLERIAADPRSGVAERQDDCRE
jgi:uncharacterized protein YaiI (UPF0178 family)